jgi:hypothetical protein
MKTLLTAAVPFFLAAASAFAADAPQHRVLGCDKGHVAIVEPDGKVSWEFPCKSTPHDVALLKNGNVLFIDGDRTVVEVSPDKKVVWKYEPKPKAGYDGPIEVHAAQRLDNTLTMIAETGNKRIIEVDSNGTILHEIPLTIDHPHPHRDTRCVRKLASGNYLVAHEGDGVIREYDPKGKVVWSYKVDLNGRPRSDGHGPEGHGTECFGAWRLESGSTLIACGNGNRVIEVTPAGKVIWSVDQKDLPGVTLAWVTMCEKLPSGNVVIGNCHAGEENPQLIEVDKDKNVVWTFKNFDTFGNSLAAWQLIDVPDAIR